MLKVWMDGHGRRPGTYFQYVLASSHFLDHFGGILESVHALLFSHFKHCLYVFILHPWSFAVFFDDIKIILIHNIE